MSSEESQPDVDASVLLVDDRAANLLALEAILEPLGLHVVRAASGREALRCVLHDDFAVILLDVEMPELNGLEVAEILKQRSQTRHVPIIFLTATDDAPEAVAAAYARGAVDYVRKPFDPDVLRGKVSALVEMYRKGVRDQLQATRRREALARQGAQRLQRLLDAMPQCVFALRADGAVDHCNRVWFDYAGMTLEQTIRAGLRGAAHTADRPSLDDVWNAAVAAGLPFEAQGRLRRAHDGAWRWHLVRGVPERDEENALVGWIVTATDIDDQRRAADAQRFIADAGELLAASLDEGTTLEAVAQLALPRLGDWCAVHLRGEDGAWSAPTVVHVDPSRTERARALHRCGTTALEPLFGIERALGAKRGALRAIDPEREPLAEAPWQIASELSLRATLVVPLVARGAALGALVFAAASGRTYHPRDLAVAEELARRVGSALERARLFRAADNARREAEAASRFKDEFLSTISHELRTPLTAMLGWLHILKTGRPETAARAIATIERNARSQARIIDDVLDVSRIVTGTMRLDPRPFDFAELVAAALDAARPAATAKSVAVDASFESVAGELAGDPDRLQQVAWNLVHNAVKFTSPGGTIAVRLTLGADEVRLAVSDSGCGISPAFLPHVFERFRQADGTPTRAHGGLGLGLAIVRHIVELHGGTVHAASGGAGFGATFVVTLPRRARGSSTELLPLAAAAGDEAVARLDATQVLVVVADAALREQLAAALTAAGATVTPACGSADAVDALGTFAPHVVLGVPAADDAWLSALRARAVEQALWFPALALTDASQGEYTTTARSGGFQARLAIPWSDAELVATVARLLGRAATAGASERPLASAEVPRR